MHLGQILNVNIFSHSKFSFGLRRIGFGSLSVLAFSTLSNNIAKAEETYPIEYISILTSEDLDEIDPNLMRIQTEFAAVEKSGVVQAATTPFSDIELMIAKLKIILDRNGVSPGAIDGTNSVYFEYAISVYNEKTGSNVSLSDQASLLATIDEAEEKDPLFVEYTLTAKDVAGPFISQIPDRIQDQAGFSELSFSSVEEALAEKFHMNEVYLKRLNPTADFQKAGTKIKVANIGSALQTRVASIKADMDGRRLYAYDKNGRIIAIYPASIGSPQNPSPKGSFKVRNKAGFPKYTLSPSNTFEPIDDGKQVIVAPGPNNPVGIAWIGLSKKSYGIHGTPWPERVGEAGSHGCIRLTNWDAMELATLVRTGIKVIIE